MALKASGSSTATPRPRAACTMASPRGCSEFTSAAAASRSTWSSGHPSAATTSVTDGSPFVSVPVLSNTMWVSRLAFSMASAPLNRMPCSAALPVPAIMALGVAMPTARGQERTSTATEISRAKPKTPIAPRLYGVSISRVAGSKKSPYPTKNQKRKTASESTCTQKMNLPATRSASRWMGALLAWASSTSLMIWASAVARPTPLALIGGDLDLRAVAEHAGDLRLQAHQFADGFGSATAGQGFQVAAQDDKRRQQRRGLQEGRLRAAEAGIRKERVNDGDEVGGADPRRVQQVHVGDAVAQPPVAVDEELPAWPEDDRGGDDKEQERMTQNLGHETRQNPHVLERPQHDDQGQRPGDEHPPPLPSDLSLPRLPLPVERGRALQFFGGLVPQIADRPLDLGRCDRPGIVGHLRRPRRQVYGDGRDTRQSPDRGLDRRHT